MAPGYEHPPSHARALAHEAKSGGGRPIRILIGEARSIPEVSYAAEALMALSGDPRLPTRDAAKLLDEVLVLAKRVERDWRRAELVAELARRSAKWRPEDDQAAGPRTRFQEGLAQVVVAMPPGKALSDAMQAVARWIPPGRRAEALSSALRNGAFALGDAKAILALGAAPGLVEVIEASPDPALRARLLAHLHGRQPGPLLPRARVAARALDPADRAEVLRQMVTGLAAEDLALVAAEAMGDPAAQARLLSTLAARADRLDLRPQALAWFHEAARRAGDVADAKTRKTVRRNLAQGLERAGDPHAAAALRAQAEADEAEERRAPPKATETPVGEPSVPAATSLTTASPAHGPIGVEQAGGARRHVLALYDTYEGGLSEVHLRAVARAAPLCYAFDLDLALMGFPTGDLDALLKSAARETNIGGGGRYLRELAADGRIHLVACTTRDPPEDWSSVGLPVATTSHPGAGKATDLPPALEAARAAAGGRLCVIMGLGKRGLPPSLLRAVAHHWELTGKRVSMETATAMGVIAERMRQLPRPP